MAAIPYSVYDLLAETRYGVSFPCDSGCQMRFKQEGKDLGGFYPYSQYGGVRGYRVYFKQRGNEIIILLCGGDKDTQQSDINTALRLASEWEAL